MSTGVLDYGVGNTGSILAMHAKLSLDARRVTHPSELDRHERFILPGVGAFDHGMRRLRSLGFEEPLAEMVVHQRRPILGVCLGMQMLADSSEESDSATTGLGWISGTVQHMRPILNPSERIPHMGWGYVRPTRSTDLLPNDETERFYFVHSYAFVPRSPTDTIATVDYGVPICAMVGRDNIVGTQFHPEKSHHYGMRLLKAFSSFKAFELLP